MSHLYSAKTKMDLLLHHDDHFVCVLEVIEFNFQNICDHAYICKFKEKHLL